MSTVLNGAFVRQHFATIGKHFKMIDFQEFVIWLIPEHYLGRLLGDFWDCFSQLLEPSPKDIKSKILQLIFSISGAHARKLINRDFWDCFSRLLGPRPQSHQIGTSGLLTFLDFWDQGHKDIKIKTSGTDFSDFWGQGQQVIKSGLLGLLLSKYGTKAGKSSNQDF